MKTIVLLILLIPLQLASQSEVNDAQKFTRSGMHFSINAGYDLPHFTKAYNFYELGGGPKGGASIGYNFLNGLGLGIDYDFLLNNPKSTLSGDIIYDNSTMLTSEYIVNKKRLQRHFIGIGPQYTLSFGRVGVQVYGRFGLGLLNGGDLVGYSTNPSTNTRDYHLLFSGFKDFELSYKMGGKVLVGLTRNLDLTLGLYHLRYFSVTPDLDIDLDNIGNVGLVYGASSVTVDNGDITLLNEDATVVREASCSACSSTGITLGFNIRFGGNKKEKGCSDCACPNDTHKVIVAVEDGPSGKVIPDADVAIRDMDGNIISTGTTNSFGVIDFGAIPHGNYVINGKVLNIETSSGSLLEEDFLPDAIIRKTIKNEDLRFILKGRTINNSTQMVEPNVVVNLTNMTSGSVEQTTSNGKGEFAFKLDKSSTYELVGIKENRLSDIDKASTIGLTRSTTLFVELKLGMDDFDCNKGTVLDIKYEFDKDALLPESKFELDRILRYMNDHQISRIELSSHTDSRGSDEYNLDLSQRRAQSAVNYIMSRGIDRSRIVANGYGESQLLNKCEDGVNCSEEDHRINRRTEAKLLCN